MAERNAILSRRCLKCGQIFVGKASVLKRHGREERAKDHNERVLKEIADNERRVKEIAERKARTEKEHADVQRAVPPPGGGAG